MPEAKGHAFHTYIKKHDLGSKSLSGPRHPKNTVKRRSPMYLFQVSHTSPHQPRKKSLLPAISRALFFIMLCLSALFFPAGCSTHAEKASTADHTGAIQNTGVFSSSEPGSGDIAASPGPAVQEEVSAYVPTFLPLPELVPLRDSNPIRDNCLYCCLYDSDPENGKLHLLPYSLELNTLELSPLDFPLEEQDRLSQIALLDNGGFALLLSRSEKDDASLALLLTDSTGKEISRYDVTDALYVESPLESNGGSPQCMNADSQGNLYIIVHSGYDSQLIVLNSQGEKLFSLTANECSGLYRCPDGAVYTLTHGSGTADSGRLTRIDLDTRDFGDSLGGIPDTGICHIAVDGGHFLISSGNTLYTYNAETQTATPLLQWTDCDVDSNTIERLTLLPDGRILVFTRTNRNQEWYREAAYLTLTPLSQIKEKIVLTYGTLYLEPDISTQIAAFNKTSDSYRIKVKEYGSGDTEDGLLQLNTDIISGNAPDILSLSYGVDAENYISKGVLADLTPFFAKDTELKPDDLISNALGIYSGKGQIYGVPLSFQIETLIGRTDDVGNQAGWTLEDIMKTADSLPGEMALIHNGSQEEVLQCLLTAGIDTFVDQDTGNCHFDGDEFIQLLELVSRFPAKEQLIRSYQTYTDLSQNQALLLSRRIGAVDDYQYAQALFQGVPITCIGYPTCQGSGSLIVPYDSFGISSQSLHPDGAWEFLRTLLINEFQYERAQRSNFFPLRRDTLETMFQEEMQKEAYRLSTRGESDFVYHQEPVTAEVTDALRQLICSAQSSLSFDVNAYNIILEEAAPYFAGQKTAAEAANVIQGRLQIYFSENR